MAQNLKNVMSDFIEKYIDILKEDGEPHEAYKYEAVNTFQKNWDIEASDFYEMFKASFSKVKNLLYPNSRQYMNTVAELFPELAREMFRNLYDESKEVSQRIKSFQAEAKEILPKVKEALKRFNINTQQDERTLAVYLAFRYPEKYTLYKSDYYKNLCSFLSIKPKKTGECFLHLQDLASRAVEEGLFKEKDFLEIHRRYYAQPDWNDQYLIFQNVLYVNLRDQRDFNFQSIFNWFDLQQLEQYYGFLDEIIDYFGFEEGDERLVFNSNRKKLIFTIGQRYIWLLDISQGKFRFNVISNRPLGENYKNFEGGPEAYWNSLESIQQVYGNKETIFRAIENELHRTQASGYLKYNKEELEKMVFDVDFRNEAFNKMVKDPSKVTVENKNPIVTSPLNLILFGAPGTGKTFRLRDKYFPRYTITEERMSPEAYFEEMVSTLTWWQVIALALLELGTSRVNEILRNKWVVKKAALSDSKNVRATVWGNLQFHTILESKTVNYTQRQAPYIFDKTESKEWRVIESELREQAPEIYDTLDSVRNFTPNPKKEIKHYVFTTFHQSFSYEDFIEGIKPVIEEDKENISYRIENGIFKEICLRAQSDLEHRYAIFIDEINRGNVSAIFGELITLIEPDKRLGAKNELKVKLPYSKREFGVPANLDIIGTMNTADRSVEALDTALRRRFSFIEMQPNPEVLENSIYKDVNLKKLLEAINRRIEVLIDKDHQIGHSYFIGVENLHDLKTVFKDKIIPLLEEYFYGDFGKIGLVLGGNFIYLEENSAKFPRNFHYDNDFLSDKKVYRFRSYEEWNVESFISVYQE